jgi:transketolase
MTRDTLAEDTKSNGGLRNRELKPLNIDNMIELSKTVRSDIIRQTNNAASGHPGGSLSGTDIMCVLFSYFMRYDPENICTTGRDRFIMSKGHCAPLIYSILARMDYFPPDELMTFRFTGSRLQGHPNMLKCPGIEVSTGSLGQGLSVGLGMALGARLNKTEENIYVMNGDGEMQEGQIWEAYMAAGHFKTDKLITLIDNNNLQIDGNVDEVMTIYPLEDKLRAFNWNVITANGHDFQEIYDAIKEAREHKGKPTAIVFSTHKGMGVSFMKDQAGWHGKPPNDEQAAEALQDIEAMEYPWS